MPSFKTLDDFDITNKCVLLRVDFNIPMEGKTVSDTTRIEKIIPTIKEILDKGAGICLLSHFGRPKGKVVAALSLEPLIPVLKSFLPNIRIIFSPAGEHKTQPGEVVLLENLRFNPGEESNDRKFSKYLSSLGDVYVNDAFSCAHRAHSSVDGVARLMPAAAGRFMQQELEALDDALNKPSHPVAAVVGGNKISTKLNVLGHLVGKVDHLIVGGAMANTFLSAKGMKIGSSLFEKDMVSIANEITYKAEKSGCMMHLPVDAAVATGLRDGSSSKIVDIKSIPAEKMILDIGPDTAKKIEQLISSCKTLVWNGPLGAFEFKPFDTGTNAVAQSAARLTNAGNLLTVAGGGDTMSALSNAGVTASFSYISSAGGAFLEWLEGKTLPGVIALMT